jgi:uncharacterized membrane protein
MSLAPLFAAGSVVTAHAFAAMAAFLLGSVQLLAPKGTLPHRTLGYLWVVLMLTVIGTSFFIYDIRMWGPFSWIHLLSLAALFGLVSLVREARRHDVREHKKSAMLLFFGAMVVAGGFTFMPGRAMHAVLFGG